MRCLLLVMCTHPIAKEALTLHLARSEGHERYFGCNLMYRKVLESSHQHLMAEAPMFLRLQPMYVSSTSTVPPSNFEDRLTPTHTKKKNGQRFRYYVSRCLIQHSGQKDLSGWRLPAPTLEQTVVHLVQQHVGAPTFSASLTHTPTIKELASVRHVLDGLCPGSNGSNDDSASAARLLRLIRRVDISRGSVSILLDRDTFAACLSMGARPHSRGGTPHPRAVPLLSTRRRDQVRSGQLPKIG